jgi:soluble lytic murein transglycosylase
MRICLAKIIPALSFSLLLFAALTASGQQQHKTATASAKKAPPKIAPPAATLAAAVRAYRDTPSAAKRAAVESYAAAHPKEAPLAHLALGITSYEVKDYADAIESLKKVRIAAIADYASYYLAAARVESKQYDGIAGGLSPVYAGEIASPFAGRSWILQARAAKENDPAGALKILRDHYAELPEPDGDINLADAYLASGDQPRAIEIYQRIVSQFLSGDAATRAAAALVLIKESMGAAYPEPSAQLLLHHADRLMDAHSFRQARTEYHELEADLKGLEHDQARVRIGVADYQEGHTSTAYPYLREMDLAPSEADAERLAYVVECTRRLNDEDDLKATLERLSKYYPKSPWRLKALLSSANRYLLINRPDEFVPLDRAVYQDFPNAPEAALAHWKVTFQAYMHDDPQAQSLLMEHLRKYPTHATAGGALYFLGRSFERAGDPGAAHLCYARLTAAWENHYYAMVARARTPEVIAPKNPEVAPFLASLAIPLPQAPPPSATRSTALRIDRSRLLRSAGLPESADAELRFGARNGGQAPLLGMEMASSAEATHTAMRIMKGMASDYLNLPLSAAPRKYWELLFPLPYRSDLEHSAHGVGVDPFLLAGLIRQESEFDPQALSSAKAYGLTQVLPVTGRQYAKKAGIQGFTNRLLFQPTTNLKIGAAILRGMLDSNSEHVEQTLAAYNAGPTRSVEWSGWNQYREPAEFVESIPFTETRDYVQAVLRNADTYRRLYYQ